ncbi:sigma-70 family RNA polymerase sigma factor [Kribbella sp. NPDC051137]|uniref:sigma-70 family RNA polymerase sigma factor n=1 Tax=Kribbella sp. NPDC051137 TaxID=3155045 RepID=UPI002F8A6702
MPIEPRRNDPPPTTDGTAADHALALLYADHAKALLGFAERFTGDRGRAEDIVQETFLRAWRQLPRLLDDDRPVRHWLFQVARRLLIDAARSASVRPQFAADSYAQEPFADGGFEQLMDRRVLVDALRDLSPQHRQIVVATFFLGCPMHVAAEQLGVPPGTARSRLHYALGRLRRQLESALAA